MCSVQVHPTLFLARIAETLLPLYPVPNTIYTMLSHTRTPARVKFVGTESVLERLRDTSCLQGLPETTQSILRLAEFGSNQPAPI